MLKSSTNIKNDTRKPWDTLKGIICKNKTKSEYPRFFTDKGHQIKISPTHLMNILHDWSSLANSIDIAGKATFDTYLKKPNSSSFQFQYTDAPSVQKVMNNLKPKSSAWHDDMSSKIFRQIGDIVAYPLNIIVNQSLCTGIFPHRVKLAKVIIYLCTKNDNKLFGNYRPISLLSSLSKMFEKSYLINYMIIWSQTVYYSKASMVSENNTRPS